MAEPTSRPGLAVKPPRDFQPIEYFDVHGFVTPPNHPYPRRYVTVSLPIGPRDVGEMRIPARMTPDEWTRLMNFVTLTREAVVDDLP